MNGGPSGFTNAPVTRAFIIASALFTIFFGIQGRFNSLGLSYQDIFGKLRLWKLIMSVFAFSSTPEMMFGLYLLYYFRVFERQIGSNKYSVFIVFSVLTSLLFEVISLALLRDPAAKLVTPGPYGLIFASYVPFFLDIPVSTRIRVFGIPFSDKSFIYLAGLQVIYVILAACVIIMEKVPLTRNVWHPCGILVPFECLLYPKSKVPRFHLIILLTIFIAIHGESTRPINKECCGKRTILSNSPNGGKFYFVARNYPAPVQYAVEPSEDSITTLVSMGFDRNSARQALVQARNDVNVATNILLEAQSH
ncbi:hypothetical protein Ahy_A10g047365 isoform A [Arachis hypogaea]|uniref:UBA domain-containing protein n=1 Tax=Arachis hypogaea TaxID=3818 RepID=A0A445B2H9_ARAHY|nr:hypothetical protein Ahy_A10g047365 isoform A [Arachis hypogaea]